MTRHKHRKKLLIGICGTILLIVILALIGWRFGWFGRQAIQLSVSQPGSAVGPAASFILEQSVADMLQQRMQKLLETEDGKGLASWYQLAGRFGQPAAARSGIYLASDQLRYGQFLLEQGSKKAFNVWWQTFSVSFIDSENLIINEINPKGQVSGKTGDFWRNNFAALRLLAQSCTIWPDGERQDTLSQMSSQLLGLAASGIPADLSTVMPTPAPTLDPAATPTPKPLATPTPDPSAATVMNVLRLATLDLFTMQQLSGLDSRWQKLYDQYLPVIQAGYLNDELPLYVAGFDGKTDYLPFVGSSPFIDTEEACLTILHLCEIGQENTRSISWIKDQLFNNSKLYTAYHITQGTAASSEECIAAYAIVARIARIKGDQDLYESAAARLLWHQATNVKSEALNALFRQDLSGIIQVRADDNTWGLLAIH